MQKAEQDFDPHDPENRQLAAVVFLDMVGYSALMQRSEARAEAAVQALWGIARPIIARAGGTEVRLFGDGMLMTFGGALAAVRACLQVFQELAALNRGRSDDERIGARAGVHLGDIGSRDGEIYGDGVNIASRLVGLAPPGGVVVSPHVRDQVRNALEHPIQSLGVKSLKNIDTPLELFCLPGPECAAAALDEARRHGAAPARIWRFGNAQFHEGADQLNVGGQAAKLDRAATAVLRYLLHHAGETVTKQELTEAADGLSEAALSRRISKLRKLLRDPDGAQLRTQPGHGYRLTVPVSVESAPSTALSQFDFKPGDHPPMRPMWQLESVLGQGGQGEVWLARHAKTGEERVYKFALDPNKLSSLKREITLSRVLHSAANNAHFIRVVDWNLDHAPYFIECEYGGGSDLPGWFQAQGGIDQLALPTRVELAAQLADALAAAHSVGVLHKDLKPANILILQAPGQPPTVKLADFGSGGVLDAQHLEDANITRMGFSQSMLNASDNTEGTAIYYAPELMTGQPVTVQADIYALGVTLYQLVVGDFRKPLSAGWEAEVSDELLREDIGEAAHGDPAKRLSDAAGFARRLRALPQRRAARDAERATAAKLAQAEAAAQAAQQRVAQLRTRRRWMLVAMAALALGLGLALRAQQQATAAAAEARAVADFLSKDLFDVVADQPLASLTVEELLKFAAENLARREGQLPAVAAQLHTALGDALFAMERFGPASSEYDKALQFFEGSDALDNENAIRAGTRLLTLSRLRLQELPKLLPRFERVLKQGLAKLGPRHPMVLELRQQLALGHFHSGDWQRGAAEFASALNDQQSAASDTGAGFGVAETRLGEMQIYLGDFSQAAATQREVLDRLAANPEAAPMSIASAGFFLARALTALERFTEAEAELERARAITENWAVSQASLMRLSLDLNLGYLRLRQGRTDEAILLLRTAADGIEAALQAAQLDDLTGEYRVILALAHRASGDTVQAEEILRDALAREQKFRGETHPLTQRARIELTKLLAETGRLGAARKELAQIDTAVLSKLGDHHPYQGRYHQARGQIAQLENERETARRELGAARAIFAASYGPTHSYTRALEQELSALETRPRGG